MCLRDCKDRRGPVRIAEVPADPGENFDAAAALRKLAAQLTEAYQADPGNALLARELRSTLLALPVGPREPSALDRWIASLSVPVSADEQDGTF